MVDITQGASRQPSSRARTMQVSSISSQDPGFQAHGVQADVVGERLPAGGEQRLVGLHLAVVFEGQGDRPGAARTAYRGDGDADPHVYPGVGERAGDQFPGEWLHPGAAGRRPGPAG